MLKSGETSVAQTILQQGFRTPPTDIVLHTGTNDIETAGAHVVAERIMNNAADAVTAYGCNVFVSTLPPRKDLQDKVEEANKHINHLKSTDKRYSQVKVINHVNIFASHLYDRKHLTSFQKGSTSGCQLLAANIYKAVVGNELQDSHAFIKQQNSLHRRRSFSPPPVGNY